MEMKITFGVVHAALTGKKLHLFATFQLLLGFSNRYLIKYWEINYKKLILSRLFF